MFAKLVPVHALPARHLPGALAAVCDQDLLVVERWDQGAQDVALHGWIEPLNPFHYLGLGDRDRDHDRFSESRLYDKLQWPAINEPLTKSANRVSLVS